MVQRKNCNFFYIHSSKVRRVKKRDGNGNKCGKLKAEEKKQNKLLSVDRERDRVY